MQTYLEPKGGAADPFWSSVYFLVNGDNQPNNAIPTVYGPTARTSSGISVTTTNPRYGSGCVRSINTFISPGFTLGDQFTIEFWIYPYGSSSIRHTLIDGGGPVISIFNDNISIIGLGNRYSPTIQSVPQNKWSHICFQKQSNSTWWGYLNGARGSSDFPPETILWNFIRFGNASNNTTLYSMDDIRFSSMMRYPITGFTPPDILPSRG